MKGRVLCVVLGHAWVPLFDLTSRWRRQHVCRRCDVVADPVKHGRRPGR